MEKPIQFTIVSAVPLAFSSVFWATNVENSGESAITVIPHKKRKQISRKGEELIKNKGDRRQHMPESNNAVNAVFFIPYLLER